MVLRISWKFILPLHETALEKREKDIAGAIEEQSAVTQKISSNMQTASGAVSDINHNLTDLSENTEAASKLSTEGIDLYRTLK